MSKGKSCFLTCMMVISLPLTVHASSVDRIGECKISAKVLKKNLYTSNINVENEITAKDSSLLNAIAMVSKPEKSVLDAIEPVDSVQEKATQPLKKTTTQANAKAISPVSIVTPINDAPQNELLANAAGGDEQEELVVFDEERQLEDVSADVEGLEVVDVEERRDVVKVPYTPSREEEIIMSTIDPFEYQRGTWGDTKIIRESERLKVSIDSDLVKQYLINQERKNHSDEDLVELEKPVSTITFQGRAGGLNDNIKSLLSHTDGLNLEVDVSENHKFEYDFEITANSVLKIIDLLVEPFVSPFPIKATFHKGNKVVYVYYAK